MNPLLLLTRIYRKLAIAFSALRLIADVRRVREFAGLCDRYAQQSRGGGIALDIGCGPEPRNPFNASTVYGVDIRDDASEHVKSADLVVEGIPFEDESMDYVTAFDFIEHVLRIVYLPERRFPFVELMNEVHRVLKPNGIFLSHTPAFPYSQAFSDPTHVNIITADTFRGYFCGDGAMARMYGFTGSFELLDQVIVGSHLVSLLRKKLP